MRALLILVSMCLGTAAGRADERLWLEARINGQPAKLIFDTGADRLILFQEGAARLGLLTVDPPLSLSPGLGQSVLGATEECNLELFQTTIRTSLDVLKMPSYLRLGADGALGWRPLSGNVVAIDAAALTVRFLPETPDEVATWTQSTVRQDSGFLFLNIPGVAEPEATVLVDTGFAGGVALAPARWRAWQRAHANQPATMDSYFMPGAGLVFKLEMWAAELTFGPVRITQVPVTEANPAQVAQGGPSYVATLGLAALKRLDVIVDGPQGIAYLRQKRAPPPPYEHNRLGAVFVPANAQEDALLAHVADHTPAQEAGIRNGDVLVRIGELDVTRWRTNPGILPFSRFWDRPAGTRLELTLKRGRSEFKVAVQLREILGPERGLPDSAGVRTPELSSVP